MALNQMKMLNDLRKAQKALAKEIVEGRIGEKYIYVDSSQNKLIFYPIHVDNGTIR